MDLRTYHCHVDTNPFKVKGEEERVYTLLIHTDLNGKEVQKGGDICVCMADSFCCTVGANTTL